MLIRLKRWKEVQFRAGRKIETKKDIGDRVFTLKIVSDRHFLVPIDFSRFWESNAMAMVVAK